MNNLLILKNILNKYGLTEYGVCDYSSITNFLECRNAIRIPSDCKSVIVIAFPYYTKTELKSNLCNYARVLDYHIVVNDYLKKISNDLKEVFKDYEFEGFSDVSAFPEHFCGQMAGVGFEGRNHLLINDRYGSFFVIGEIATNLYFEASKPDFRSCKQCGLCVRNCPSKALNAEKDDFSKCLSEVTQRKGELTDSEIQLIKNNGLVWGCDVCQNVCPHNKNIEETYIKEFYESVELNLTYDNLSTLKKNRAFGYRGRNLLLRNLDILYK